MTIDAIIIASLVVLTLMGWGLVYLIEKDNQ